MGKVFIYCPRKSDGALSLVKGLEAVRLRRFDGLNFRDRRGIIKIPQGSTIVCWGAHIPDIGDGVRVLNSLEKHVNKFDEAQLFLNAKIPTVQVISSKKIRGAEKKYLQMGWLPRRADHQGGLDLLANRVEGDYWVKKEDLVEEYRIHSFNGKSIRAGQKVPRDGFIKVNPEGGVWKPNQNLIHPWVRSFDGGWRIKYDGFKSNKAMRGIAHAAVKALGLTFGAVDIGQKGDGTLIVLEVNSAPGLEGGSIEAYKRSITKWIENPKPEAEE